MTVGLKTLGFRAYLATQFLGAFNDNAFRFTFILFVLDAVQGDGPQGQWLAVSQVLFALPFIVFVAIAGAVADRWAKSRVIRVAKLAEIGIMAVGVAAFGIPSLPLLALVLFVMATQSAFFGPAKYGYLAENMAESDLVRANALVQLTTMLAIVSGQLAAGWIHARFSDDLAEGAIWFVAFAVVGTLTSAAVTRVEPARPDARLGWNPLPDLALTWRGVRADRTLLYSFLGNAHYFLLVAALQVNLAAYGEQGFGPQHDLGAAMMATTTVALGLGSLLASRWSEGRVELGLVPLGALSMTAGLVLVALVPPVPVAVPEAWWSGATGGAAWISAGVSTLLVEGLWAPFAATALLGLAGGLYVVPLWALMQQFAPENEKGRYLAFANMVGFVGIAFSALLLWVPRELGMGFPGQFLLLAAIALIGTVVSLRLQPFAFVRLLGWLLAHSLYRIRVRHAERLPERGGVLLLVNHVSWVDALVLGICTRRKIHFLMYRAYYEWWPTHWFFRLLGCIPIAPGDRPEVTAASLTAAGELLDQGRVVAIFGEGEVTRLGHMLPFRTGYRRVIAGRRAAIVPVYLGGLWGSVLSHQGGRFLRRVPRLSPRPVTVSFGDPMPAHTPPHAARAAIRALAAESWARAPRAPLHVAFAREARHHLHRTLHDDRGTRWSPAGLLARAELLTPRLARRLGDARRVALVLPAGCASTAAQVALLRSGRVPVLLDPGWDAARRRQAADDAGAQAWLLPDEQAAQAFADERRPHVALAPLLADLSRVGLRLRMARNLIWGLLPMRRAGGGDAAVVAAVVFDADGRPRSLTHSQLAAQAEGLQQVLDPRADDAVLSQAPAGSALSLATGTWLPLLAGIGVAWVAEAGNGRAVGRAAQRAGVSMWFGTPAELEACLHGVKPDAFGGLKLALVARGELSVDLEQRFLDRFGLRPSAGWAPDGCAGLASLNTPDMREPGLFQRGTRAGTLGHPLAGVHVSVVDGSGEPVPPDVEGRLVLHGACVDGSGASAWTGRMDAEGFLTLSAQPT